MQTIRILAAVALLSLAGGTLAVQAGSYPLQRNWASGLMRWGVESGAGLCLLAATVRRG